MNAAALLRAISGVSTESPVPTGIITGIGIDGEGAGFVYDRDRFGRPQCIYRAAAELILADGGHPDRIID
jgi:hypothetical protein